MKKFIVLALLLLVGCTHKTNDIAPLAYFKGYKVYDLVRQKELECKGKEELIVKQSGVKYYLPCEKSDKILFIGDEETLNIKEFYEEGHATAQQLYILNLVEIELEE